MKVRILRDTVDYKAGREVQMDDWLAGRWIQTGLAEAVGVEAPTARAMPAPENKAMAAPENRAKRKRKKAE